MPAPMIKTRTPGVYRRGGRYVAVYYDSGGRQRKESARTYEDARRLKAARQADVARGEYEEASRTKFAAYFRAWVERYQGRGRRGFRESTRDDYRRLGETYLLPFLGENVRVGQVTPKRVAEYVDWLCAQTGRNGRPLSDSTIRNAVNPLRSVLATAVSEGLIRHNPAQGIALPHRPTVEDGGWEEVRPLTREQLRLFLALVNPSYAMFFKLLAATGLRVSEAVALQRKHLHLDGSQPHVMVRRALVKGRLQPPKSKYGRRQVPLDATLVDELRGHLARATTRHDDDLVFVNAVGGPLDADNVRSRVLKPVAQEIDAPWMGFHTMRHTCASMLFARGNNAVQVQRWLGHHSPSFTLDTYVHLLDERLTDPLMLTDELRGNEVATDATGPDGVAPAPAGSLAPLLTA